MSRRRSRRLPSLADIYHDGVFDFTRFFGNLHRLVHQLAPAAVAHDPTLEDARDVLVEHIRFLEGLCPAEVRPRLGGRHSVH